MSLKVNTGWVWEKSSVLSIRETYASSCTCLWSRKMTPLPMLHTTISGLKMKPNSLQYTLADMLVVQVSHWQISFPITLLFFFKISLENANNVHIFHLGMLIHLRVVESRNLLTIYIKYVYQSQFLFPQVMLSEGMIRAEITDTAPFSTSDVDNDGCSPFCTLLIKLLRAAVWTRTTQGGGLTSVWQGKFEWLTIGPRSLHQSHIHWDTWTKMARLSKSNQWLWRSGELRSQI